jgi:hypothetical protein
MSDSTAARRRGQQRGMPGRRERGNGLRDDSWVPILSVDGRIVADLLAELHRAGIPAYCARFRLGWHFLLRSGNPWCLWVGASACEKAEERLADVMPLLIDSLRRQRQRRDPSACLRDAYRPGDAGHERDSGN